MNLFHPFDFRTFSRTLPAIPITLLVTLGLTMSSCQNSTRETPQATNGTVSPSPLTTVSPSPLTTDSKIVVVRSLTTGDRACYMKLENAQGQSSEALAKFDICTQSQLVNKRVRLTRKPTPISAMSCQGNPECKEKETVNLITAVEVVP
ncbi:hypothetical protein H6F89_13250 [Cyanobacteria bacterium FACHB-63]|nr:hypothetical protein [Cyanobacteria bacterium FACHB-63]